jgi:hypothetical protein
MRFINPVLLVLKRAWEQERRKKQIPPDLVVKPQLIDIAKVVLSPIKGDNIVQTPYRRRQARFERYSTSEDYWSTT